MSVPPKSGPNKERLLDEIADWLKSMADPTRLRILHSLHPGERCVNDILGVVRSSQANVSKHLAILRKAGLVDCRREGVNVYYRITDPSVFTICEAVCDSIQRDLEHRQEELREGRDRIREGAHA